MCAAGLRRIIDPMLTILILAAAGTLIPALLLTVTDRRSEA
jgi:hypothetical protein